MQAALGYAEFWFNQMSSNGKLTVIVNIQVVVNFLFTCLGSSLSHFFGAFCTFNQGPFRLVAEEGKSKCSWVSLDDITNCFTRGTSFSVVFTARMIVCAFRNQDFFCNFLWFSIVHLSHYISLIILSVTYCLLDNEKVSCKSVRFEERRKLTQ